MKNKKFNNSWSLEDIIDLEYFFYMDQSGAPLSSLTSKTFQGPDSESRLAQRDREIFLREISPLIDDPENTIQNQDSGQIAMLRMWLESRRRNETVSQEQRFLPGAAFKEIYLSAVLILSVCGMISGLGAAFGLLAYSGDKPINVTVYFGIFVVLQLFLVVLTAASIAAYAVKSRWSWSFPRSLMMRLLSWLLLKTGQKLSRHLSADQRDSFLNALGLIKRQGIAHGPLFYTRLFMLIQFLAIGINCGIISGTLLKVVSVDLAFGWQSTIQFSGQSIHQFVKLVAWPWSWLVDAPYAYPTLDQITGSRMFLKNGILQLATADLIAWWPFLCLAVFFYGLVPRILFLTGGYLFLRRRRFNTSMLHRPTVDRLLQRMLTPLLKTDNPFEERVTSHESQYPDRPAAFGLDSRQQSPSVQSFALMVPDELAARCEETFSVSPSLNALPFKINKIFPLAGYWEADQPVVAAVLNDQKDMENPKLIILHEAWQPPIREIMLFFKQIRNTYKKVPIHILLIGKPLPENMFTAVDHHDWQIWMNAVGKTGDPLLFVERIP